MRFDSLIALLADLAPQTLFARLSQGTDGADRQGKRVVLRRAGAARDGQQVRSGGTVGDARLVLEELIAHALLKRPNPPDRPYVALMPDAFDERRRVLQAAALVSSSSRSKG